MYKNYRTLTYKWGEYNEKFSVTWWGYGNMRIMQRLLPNTLPDEYNITLIDKIPFHGLKTEFYALAAGTESDKDVRVEFPKDKRLNIVFGK